MSSLSFLLLPSRLSLILSFFSLRRTPRSCHPSSISSLTLYFIRPVTDCLIDRFVLAQDELTEVGDERMVTTALLLFFSLITLIPFPDLLS